MKSYVQYVTSKKYLFSGKGIFMLFILLLGFSLLFAANHAKREGDSSEANTYYFISVFLVSAAVALTYSDYKRFGKPLE